MSEAHRNVACGVRSEERDLRRGFEAFARRISRVLSARAQTRLEVALCGIEPSTVTVFAAELGAFERAAVLELAGRTSPAFVLLSRPLAFALLALRFGADSSRIEHPLPERPYTRIEERSLEQTARELWSGAHRDAPALLPELLRVAGLDDAEGLRARGDVALWILRFVVRGLGSQHPITITVPRRETATSHHPGGEEGPRAD